MKRIIVIGNSGAGKSTFARKLSKIIGINVYPLDMIWHKPDKTTVTRDEFDEKLSEIMKKEAWIIDGNYSRTLSWRLEQSDTIFLLDYPLSVCLQGVESRIGKKREDMPWIEQEFEDEFKQWIIDFSKNKRSEIYQLIKNNPDKEYHIFYSREEANQYLDNLRE